MADSGVVRLRQQAWQRANIMAVAGYLREVLAQEPGNARVQTLYDGLLEVMEPARRALRQQRALAGAAPEGLERRRAQRRAGCDRRQFGFGPPFDIERRSGHLRRAGTNRRMH